MEVIAGFVLRKIEEEPISEQVKLYDALSQVLTAPADREAAKQIVQHLSSTAALQLEFSTSLLSKLPSIQ